MAFCKNCGQRLPEGAKFCNNCGTTTGVMKQKTETVVAPTQTPPTEEIKKPQNDEPITKRQTVYDGEIHKCPNCGEIIDAFAAKCPTCNYEIRGSKATVSLQQFYWNLHRTNNSVEKASIIRNYPISNSKEDIVEFMILASSNISGESDKNIFEAWVAKFEQAYQKAQIALQSDPAFAQIEDVYEKTEKTINKEKISHTTASVGNIISRFFKSMPNPFVALIVIWIGFCMISAIVRESYIFIIIAAVAFIAYLIYKKYKDNKNDKS